MVDFEVPSLRIAVAEDDTVNRTTFVRLLEALGHTVPVAAIDGLELLEGCKNHAIDLVITDFLLPEMDGLAAAEHLSDVGLPVIIISGHPDAENIRVAYEPVVSVLRKPVMLNELRHAIWMAVNSIYRPATT